MASTYCVYVSDDNGWGDDCPSTLDVFFGSIPAGGRWVGRPDSAFGGHVEFGSQAAAEAYRAELERSGDWTSRRTGEERRPSYDVAEIDA